MPVPIVSHLEDVSYLQRLVVLSLGYIYRMRRELNHRRRKPFAQTVAKKLDISVVEAEAVCRHFRFDVKTGKAV